MECKLITNYFLGFLFPREPVHSTIMIGILTPHGRRLVWNHAPRCLRNGIVTHVFLHGVVKLGKMFLSAPRPYQIKGPSIRTNNRDFPQKPSFFSVPLFDSPSQIIKGIRETVRLGISDQELI